MSILQKIEKCYGNLIESIKLCLDKEQKMIMIGSLAIDIGKRCISALSKIFHLSRKTIRKAICLFKKEVKYKPDIETRGRKSLSEKYPTLKEDISETIENHCSTDPRFKHEKQYVKLTIKEIISKLIETRKYTENSFKKSAIANLLNKMGYNLKKVKKNETIEKN